MTLPASSSSRLSLGREGRRFTTLYRECVRRILNNYYPLLLAPIYHSAEYGLHMNFGDGSPSLRSIALEAPATGPFFGSLGPSGAVKDSERGAFRAVAAGETGVFPQKVLRDTVGVVPAPWHLLCTTVSMGHSRHDASAPTARHAAPLANGAGKSLSPRRMRCDLFACNQKGAPPPAQHVLASGNA
jgi:hypothetical protein